MELINGAEDTLVFSPVCNARHENGFISGYHVTLMSNLRDILLNGLYCSESGALGKGVYLFSAELDEAKELCLNYLQAEDDELEFYKQNYAVIQVDYCGDYLYDPIDCEICCLTEVIPPCNVKMISWEQ